MALLERDEELEALPAVLAGGGGGVSALARGGAVEIELAVAVEEAAG